MPLDDSAKQYQYLHVGDKTCCWMEHAATYGGHFRLSTSCKALFDVQPRTVAKASAWSACGSKQDSGGIVCKACYNCHTRSAYLVKQVGSQLLMHTQLAEATANRQISCKLSTASTGQLQSCYCCANLHTKQYVAYLAVKLNTLSMGTMPLELPFVPLM